MTEQSHHPDPTSAQDSDSLRALELLRESRQGDTRAMNELISLIYPELKRRACWLMSGERRGHTFGQSGSELVQRVLEKMIGAGEGMIGSVETEEALIGLLTWHMRNILVDYARAQGGTAKRAAPAQRVEFENTQRVMGSQVHSDTVLIVNEALTKLTREDPQASKAVELRYYAELTNAEAAAAMGLSEAKFRRELKRGVVFLRLTLGDQGPALE
jgi:RNA polymerase sigma factor (TIGR02999 family)